MQFLVLLALVATTFAAVYDVYPTKYDDIDIDNILGNKRLFEAYFQCLVKKSKCSEEGALLRDIIPDALLTGCRKCNEKQRGSVRKVATFLYKEHRGKWDELVNTYDPKGEFKKEYAQYLEEL